MSHSVSALIAGLCFFAAVCLIVGFFYWVNDSTNKRLEKAGYYYVFRELDKHPIDKRPQAADQLWRQAGTVFDNGPFERGMRTALIEWRNT